MNLIKKILPTSLLVIIPSITLYVLILYFSVKAGIDPILVLRDPIQACDYPTNVGMISNIGVLMWAAASVISLFTATSGLLKKNRRKNMLLSGAILSGILCLDDLFLLHDRHVGQNFIYVTYTILTIFILIRFSKLILKDESLSFFISSSFLGLSILADKFQTSFAISYSTIQLYEEGFKFVGIACWLFFWWNTSVMSLKSNDIIDN